jgi:hypothetical protein
MTLYILIGGLVISILVNIVLARAFIVASYRIGVYEEWILTFQKNVKDTFRQLRYIDEKEIFERDDEVGFVFSNIVSIIDDLKEKTYAETEEERKENEEFHKKREDPSIGRFSR